MFLSDLSLTFNRDKFAKIPNTVLSDTLGAVAVKKKEDKKWHVL